jgi:hypothetical protein
LQASLIGQVSAYSEAILLFAMRQAGEEKASIYRDTAAMI